MTSSAERAELPDLTVTSSAERAELPDLTVTSCVLQWAGRPWLAGLRRTGWLAGLAGLAGLRW